MSTVTDNTITIFLRLSSGETFEDIPVPNLDLTLAEFLDQVLKDLEVPCSINGLDLFCKLVLWYCVF